MTQGQIAQPGLTRAAALPVPRHRLTRALRRLRVFKRRQLGTPRGGVRMGLGFTALLIGVMSAGEAHAAPGWGSAFALAAGGCLSFMWGALRSPGGMRSNIDMADFSEVRKTAE